MVINFATGVWWQAKKMVRMNYFLALSSCILRLIYEEENNSQKFVALKYKLILKGVQIWRSGFS